MSTETRTSPRFFLRRANGETQEIRREDVRGGQAAPRPLDDDQLDDVAGGITQTVTYPDGCTIIVRNAHNEFQALEDADYLHAASHFSG